MSAVRTVPAPVGSQGSGRVCVVTGATSGIGYVTARELARDGFTVAVVGRDGERTAQAAASIASTSGHRDVRPFVADLFLRSEARRLASELMAAYPRIHVLVNNAGAVFSRRDVTAEGIERTWALNVVSPFLLTHLLLPRLGQSGPTRVINVSSAAHRGARLDFADLQSRSHYSGFGAYRRSKLALLLLTHEFARQLAETTVTVNALHPGFVATRFGRNNPGAFGLAIGLASFLVGVRAKRGARTSIFLASDPSVATVTGKYFHNEREIRSSAASHDPVAAARLWDVLSVQTGTPTDILSQVR